MLVILCGPPCTGKSTIGAELERQLRITHLDVDVIRKQLLPHSDQRIEDRDIAYRAMHLVAQYLLRSGGRVIVNATYNREIHRRAAASLASTAILIQCRAPLETVLSRFKSRPPGHAALDLNEILVRQLWTNYAWSTDGIIVDNVDDALERVNSSQTDSLQHWTRMV